MFALQSLCTSSVCFWRQRLKSTYVSTANCCVFMDLCKSKQFIKFMVYKSSVRCVHIKIWFIQTNKFILWEMMLFTYPRCVNIYKFRSVILIGFFLDFFFSRSRLWETHGNVCIINNEFTFSKKKRFFGKRNVL